MTRHANLLRYVMVVVIVLIPLVCLAEENVEVNGDESVRTSEWKDLQCFGLGVWVPGDSDLWETGRVIRFTGVGAKSYFYGTFGSAKTASGAIRTSEGTTVEDVGTFGFFGVGVGAKLIRWNKGRSFVGAGGSVYNIETPEIVEGWIWVDEYGREIAPVREEHWKAYPEITAQVQVSRRLALDVCATIGSGKLPPSDGIYIGLTYRKW